MGLVQSRSCWAGCAACRMSGGTAFVRSCLFVLCNHIMAGLERVLQGTQMVNELLPFIEMNFVWLSNKHLLLFSS